MYLNSCSMDLGRDTYTLLHGSTSEHCVLSSLSMDALGFKSYNTVVELERQMRGSSRDGGRHSIPRIGHTSSSSLPLQYFAFL